MKAKNLLLVLALFVALSAYAPPRTPGDPTPLLTRPQGELLAALQSSTDLKTRMDACRELAVVGNAKAVPALIALMADEKLNHNARYALETMPDAGINAALRAQLPRLHGRQLAGVITTLGVRKDTGSVGALKKFLSDADADIVQATARALSRIGTSEAASAIQAALATTAAGNKLALYESWLRTADGFVAKHNAKAAQAIYDRIRATCGLPAQVKMGAVRGAILARGPDAKILLTECLWTGDYTTFAAAVQTAMELPGPQITSILAACAAHQRADNQILIIQALGRRGAEAVPALADFADPTPVAATAGRRGNRARAESNPQSALAVRIAAIHALAETDQQPALTILVGLLDDGEETIRRAALDGIAAMSCKEADATVLAMLKSTNTSDRLMGLELAGSRRMTGSLGAVVSAASDADAGVRRAALKRWGELASPSDVADLLLVLRPVTDAADLAAAEGALIELCGRAAKPEEICDELIGIMSQAQPGQRASILSVLGSVGTANSLPAIRAALSESGEVRAAAVKALCDWPEATVLADLLTLAKSGGNSEKSPAFSGYVRLVGESSAAPADKVKQLREIASLAGGDADKKLLLGGLGGIVSTDSLKLAASYLSEAALVEEAGAAVVQIAGKLPATDKEAIGPALNEVLKSVKSETVQTKARKRLTDLGL